jgi:hypothetical protein
MLMMNTATKLLLSKPFKDSFALSRVNYVQSELKYLGNRWIRQFNWSKPAVRRANTKQWSQALLALDRLEIFVHVVTMHTYIDI